MIKKIKASPLDIKYLALRSRPTTPITDVDFSRALVHKPWGKEYLVYSNDESEVWNLFIRNQRSTSMHCHPRKQTVLLVLDGRALFSTLNESWELLPMDAMVIDAGVFHSTQCISKEGLKVLEFETPPMKHDLVRLEDKYGRTQQGYEGINSMTVDTERIRFTEPNNDVIKTLHNREICIRKIQNHGDITEHVNGGRTLAIMLGGIIESGSGEVLYKPSHVLTIEELQDAETYIFNNVSMMFIR